MVQTSDVVQVLVRQCGHLWGARARATLVVATRLVVLKMSSGRSGKIDLFQSFRSNMTTSSRSRSVPKIVAFLGSFFVFFSLSGVLIY